MWRGRRRPRATQFHKGSLDRWRPSETPEHPLSQQAGKGNAEMTRTRGARLRAEVDGTEGHSSAGDTSAICVSPIDRFAHGCPKNTHSGTDLFESKESK